MVWKKGKLAHTSKAAHMEKKVHSMVCMEKGEHGLTIEVIQNINKRI